MKFIFTLFIASALVMVYDFFEESNEPPRNLIKALLETIMLIFFVIFFASRYVLIFR
jgi:hypothetical protein